jgi:hypothetical protein
MARPRLSEDIKLSKRFTFRLSEAELLRINGAAEICGKSPGTLAREKLFKGRFPKARKPKLDSQHYTELKKIGVNLNQLTKLCHTGRIPNQLLGVLMRLEQRLDLTVAKLVYDSHSKDR